MSAVSPLAPKGFPRLPTVAGVSLAAAACGIKKRVRSDLMIAELVPGTRIAGVFTTSLTAGPTVRWCREAIRNGRARAIVVNSGNANVFTGRKGAADVRATARAAARAIGCAAEDIMVSATGVIGVPLPIDKITRALPDLAAAAAPGNWEAAARAICTTDTFPKGAGATARIGGVTVRIAGIAKGSGMIMPNMATMLAYVFTDAALPAPVLRKLLKAACDRSFNAITVDSDTSTSDTLLLAATGQAEPHRIITRADDPALRDFRAKLDAVMIDLAKQIVRDGEGATKFVTITVTGAASDRSAKTIAMSVANSPLVKTAIAGADANWGRIVAAVGKAGERINADRLTVSVGGVRITENGAPRQGYREAPVARHMKGRTIDIAVDVGLRPGRGTATVWTCDLTHGYISINGDYRS
ncbi:MAG: bifunctional glutamate N-acetyltransferase/amino-acid acetyltransferase ArgJ [Alphaproteobacteria bacterium]|nr:bifunctional glutamate N-acetyltransferase/amino-acid acetyltransferase ArgJ [Alphaproteobacteria bacterium]